MKTKDKEFVLQDWVADLTFQQQALLMTAVRGPDENNKYNAAKAVIRYFRGVLIKPAGECILEENDNDFMWGDYAKFEDYVTALERDHDEYPHHFLMHLIHCAEIVGYHHPNLEIATNWNCLYLLFCRAFHMNPETKEEMNKRLNDFK